jgi:hypothetical protein
MTLTVLLGQIPLSPPLSVRLIALAVVEVVLLILVVVLWLKYEQLKTVSVDEWWQRRKQAGVSPRVERMMRESHDAWLSERSEAAESGPTGGGESLPVQPRPPDSRSPEPRPPAG